MNIRKLAIVGMLISSYAGWCAQAEDLFVDQHHPESRDGNPGTEAEPFKTIQPAVDAARSGDTICVKEGLYSDRVRLSSFGRPTHPIMLTAWKEDRVVIGSELRELPPADQWKPIDAPRRIPPAHELRQGRRGGSALPMRASARAVLHDSPGRLLPASRQTSLGSDAWPIARLTGMRVLGTRENMRIDHVDFRDVRRRGRSGRIRPDPSGAHPEGP